MKKAYKGKKKTKTQKKSQDSQSQLLFRFLIFISKLHFNE